MDGFDRFVRSFIVICGILVVGFVSVLLLSPFVSINMNPGTGEKVGYVIRMTEEGILCKTLEAQLIRGGLQDGSGAFGVTPFEFTVPNQFAEKVKMAMDRQIEVIIKYDVEGVYATCNTGSGGYILTDINPR